MQVGSRSSELETCKEVGGQGCDSTDSLLFVPINECFWRRIKAFSPTFERLPLQYSTLYFHPRSVCKPSLKSNANTEDNSTKEIKILVRFRVGPLFNSFCEKSTCFQPAKQTHKNTENIPTSSRNQRHLRLRNFSKSAPSKLPPPMSHCILCSETLLRATEVQSRGPTFLKESSSSFPIE